MATVFALGACPNLLQACKVTQILLAHSTVPKSPSPKPLPPNDPTDPNDDILKALVLLP